VPFPAGAGVGVGCLLAGRLVLKVAHSNVAVQRRAIVDLQPADLDVAAEARVAAQGQLVPGGHHALDVAFQRHVRALQKGLDVRAIGDVDKPKTIGRCMRGCVEESKNRIVAKSSKIH
jgi:hypothetical protein